MPKKKYKFKLFDIECSITDIDQTKPLMTLINHAANYERQLHHISNVEYLFKLHDDIARQIKEQLK